MRRERGRVDVARARELERYQDRFGDGLERQGELQSEEKVETAVDEDETLERGESGTGMCASFDWSEMWRDVSIRRGADGR